MFLNVGPDTKGTPDGEPRKRLSNSTLCVNWVDRWCVKRRFQQLKPFYRNRIWVHSLWSWDTRSLEIFSMRMFSLFLQIRHKITSIVCMQSWEILLLQAPLNESLERSADELELHYIFYWISKMHTISISTVHCRFDQVFTKLLSILPSKLLTYVHTLNKMMIPTDSK